MCSSAKPETNLDYNHDYDHDYDHDHDHVPGTLRADRKRGLRFRPPSARVETREPFCNSLQKLSQAGAMQNSNSTESQ